MVTIEQLCELHSFFALCRRLCAFRHPPPDIFRLQRLDFFSRPPSTATRRRRISCRTCARYEGMRKLDLSSKGRFRVKGKQEKREQRTTIARGTTSNHTGIPRNSTESERRGCHILGSDVARVHQHVGTVKVVRSVRGEEEDRRANLIDTAEAGPGGLRAVVLTLGRVGAAEEGAERVSKSGGGRGGRNEDEQLGGVKGGGDDTGADGRALDALTSVVLSSGRKRMS